MLRQAAARLSRGLGLRAVSSSSTAWADAAQQESKDQFLAKFAEVVPSTVAPPNFPSDYLPAPEESTQKAEKLSLDFYLPHETYFSKEPVDLLLIPANTGDFGVMTGHVPTIAQLRPGVVQVHKELDKDVEKYFVSSGFAFVHADSTAEVCAVEAVKLEELDPAVVRAGLDEYTAKLVALQGKGEDYEIAAAQIGVEVYSAMSFALGL